MLLAITKKELERIETMIAPTLIRERYEKKIDWLFSGLYCLIVLAIFVEIFCTDIALPNSLFLAFLLFAPTAMLVIAISKPIKKISYRT